MALLAGVYLLFSEFIFNKDPELWMERFYSRPLLIYLIYTGSEIFFGIFPPEIFMLWAFNGADLMHYWLNVTFFALVSYGAGFLAFSVGRLLRKVLMFRYLGRKFFSKYWPLFRKYGSFLILVSALTPLPWATISMLVGSTEYPMRRFLLLAFVRIVRFFAYGYIIWQTHQF